VHGLCRIRFRQREKILWVHAIRVNQLLIAQRNEEVALVTTIDRKYERCPIWLREHCGFNGGSDELIRNSSELSRFLQIGTLIRRLNRVSILCLGYCS